MPINDQYAELEGWTPETFPNVGSSIVSVTDSLVSATIEEQNAAVRKEVAGGIDTREARLGSTTLGVIRSQHVNVSKGIKPDPNYL